jgi:hypothetical protein
MPTSLADLLDELTRRARCLPAAPDTGADAATAIGVLGDTLPRLRPIGTDRSNAPAPLALAHACRELARGTDRHAGRLTDLAGATADTIGVLRDELTDPTRWAATVAISDTLHALVDGHVRDRRPLDLAAARRVHEVRRALTDLDRAAGRQPPNQASATILHRPIPSPYGVQHAAARVIEAAAGILHYTQPSRRLTLSEILAVTIAADSLHATARALLEPESAHPTPWRSVQRELRPFQDGSRRRGRAPSPLVLCALDLHDAVTSLTRDGTVHAATRAAVSEALPYLTATIDNLIVTVDKWASTRALHARAIDLNAGERYPAEYLAGRRPAGIIPAGRPDLLAARTALARARAQTVRLTATLDYAVRDASKAQRHVPGHGVRAIWTVASTDWLVGSPQAELQL